MQVTRNVQRAGPKARKGSARASFSLFFYLFSSLLFSFANGSKTLRAPASHGAQKRNARRPLFTSFPPLRSPSLLLTGPDSAPSARKLASLYQMETNKSIIAHGVCAGLHCFWGCFGGAMRGPEQDWRLRFASFNDPHPPPKLPVKTYQAQFLDCNPTRIHCSVVV